MEKHVGPVSRSIAFYNKAFIALREEQLVKDILLLVTSNFVYSMQTTPLCV